MKISELRKEKKGGKEICVGKQTVKLKPIMVGVCTKLTLAPNLSSPWYRSRPKEGGKEDLGVTGGRRGFHELLGRWLCHRKGHTSGPRIEGHRAGEGKRGQDLSGREGEEKESKEGTL